MKVGSLFTGIGGFDVGLEAAGMDIAWQCEQDESCVRVLRKRFPNTEIYRDVREVDGRSIEPVRLLCGGFPCQDLSVAGRRAGLAGKRSGLFYEFMRLVDECSPDWVLLENVPGLLSSNGGRDMAAVVGALGNRGYWWAYRVLDSQFFGLAQRRKRVFIVASRRNRTSAAEVLFERESVPGDSPPRRKTGKDVAAATAACLNSGGNSGGFRTDPGEHLVAYRTTGNCGVFEQGDKTAALNCGTDPNQNIVAYQCHGSNVGPMGTVRSGNGNETGGVPFVAMCLNGKRGNRYDGEPETFITHALTAEGHDASEDGTGRGTPIVPIAFTANGDRYGKKEKANASSLLLRVRKKVGEKAFAEWGLGILDSFQSPEVLRSTVLRQIHHERKIGRQCQFGPDDGKKPCPSGSMREVRHAGRERCAPQEWRLSRQSNRELRAYLSKLPQQNTPTKEVVRDLWEASEGIGVLREALSEIQEMGASFDGKEQSTHTSKNREGGLGVSHAVRRLTPL